MSRATSFYYAFVVLPKPQREAIIAVWDFCRAVDDVVDEPPPGARGRSLRPAAALRARCRNGEQSSRDATPGRRRHRRALRSSRGFGTSIFRDSPLPT